MTNEEFEKIEKMMNESAKEDNVSALAEESAGCLSTFYNNLYNMDEYFKEELTIMFFNKLMNG